MGQQALQEEIQVVRGSQAATGIQAVTGSRAARGIRAEGEMPDKKGRQPGWERLYLKQKQAEQETPSQGSGRQWRKFQLSRQLR